jgi:hypothetical protein
MFYESGTDDLLVARCVNVGIGELNHNALAAKPRNRYRQYISGLRRFIAIVHFSIPTFTHRATKRSSVPDSTLILTLWLFYGKDVEPEFCRNIPIDRVSNEFLSFCYFCHSVILPPSSRAYLHSNPGLLPKTRGIWKLCFDKIS